MENGEASRSFSAIGGWKSLKYGVRFTIIVKNVAQFIIFKFFSEIVDIFKTKACLHYIKNIATK